MALLAAIALDLGHRHAVHPDRGQRLAHLVELEGFYHGDDEFHGGGLAVLAGARSVMPVLSAIRAKNKRNVPDGGAYPQVCVLLSVMAGTRPGMTKSFQSARP